MKETAKGEVAVSFPPPIKLRVGEKGLGTRLIMHVCVTSYVHARSFCLCV